MAKQIPHGDEDLTCPFHQKSMADVCHRCPLWVQIRGKDPQSMQEIDQWNCALGWLPMLLIENAQQVRQGAAATESFRNEMVKLAEAPKIAGLPGPVLIGLTPPNL